MPRCLWSHLREGDVERPLEVRVRVRPASLPGLVLADRRRRSCRTGMMGGHLKHGLRLLTPGMDLTFLCGLDQA
ncbi:unnamed protein product [Merluccius merluccius]